MKRFLGSITLGIILLTKCAYGGDRYFLCGPDEDKCDADNYQFCGCIPYNEVNADTPHCLDFITLTCTPSSQKPQCKDGLVFPSQGECIATIYQSEPTPTCPIITYAFCMEHHIKICDPNGNPWSCH